MSNGNILIHLSGSISCFKACTLIDLLLKDGYAIRTSASDAALRFIGKATLEGLTGQPVLTDLFAGEPTSIPHVAIAQHWTDLIIAYPASANLINRLAAGLCDDLFGAICLANNFHKPLCIAPAMNSEMFAHPAVRASLATLEAWGAIVFPTEEGRLACGAVGQGRLLSPEKSYEKIREILCAS